MHGRGLDTLGENPRFNPRSQAVRHTGSEARRPIWAANNGQRPCATRRCLVARGVGCVVRNCDVRTSGCQRCGWECAEVTPVLLAAVLVGLKLMSFVRKTCGTLVSSCEVCSVETPPAKCPSILPVSPYAFTSYKEHSALISVP
jgi:hypothetical protein